MKKIITIVCSFLMYSSILSAQDFVTGGYRRAGTNIQVKAMQSQKIAETLGITIEKAQLVDAILQDYNLKCRAVLIDTRMTDSAKKQFLIPLQKERREKLLEVISIDQLARLDGRKFNKRK